MDDVITKVNDSINLEGTKSLSSYIRPPINTSSPNGEGWGTGTIVTIVLIVVVLALLGLNIFSYLAEGTDYLGWIVGKYSKKLPETAKDIVDTTVTGIDLGVDVAAGAVKNAGDLLARELDLKRTKLWKERDQNIKGSIHSRDLPGINNFPQHEPKHDSNYKETTEDDNIQERKKPGYCYIGTDRGYRSCIKVNKYDDCESKKVFPTMDVCINPELRA
jgi:hypothetical protein